MVTKEELSTFINYINSRDIPAQAAFFLCDPNDKEPVKNCGKHMTKAIFYEMVVKTPEETWKDIWNASLEKLFSYSQINLLYLTGYEGTGKTTFLNGLLYKIKKKCEDEDRNYDRINFDFNHKINSLLLMNSNISFISDSFSKESITKRNFLFLVLYGLGKILDKIFVIVEKEKNCDFLFFVLEFFEELKGCLGGHYDNSGEKIIEILTNSQSINKKELLDAIKSCFLSGDEIGNVILSIMRFTLYLQLSYSYYLSIPPNSRSKGYHLFWTFDNIEHFITVDDHGFPIRNADIAGIYNWTKTFADEFMGNLAEFQYKGIKSDLKIIFVLRNVTKYEIFTKTTAQWEIDPNSLATMSEPENLIKAREIIEQKRSFFIELKGLKEVTDEKKIILGEIIEKIDIIIELIKDDKSESSFFQMMQRMFNYDVRKIVDNMFKIFENPETTRRYKSISKLGANDYLDLDEIKRFKRRAALNLMLQRIRMHDHFLTALEIGDNNEGQLGYSYARQIITYLYNMSEEQMEPTLFRFVKDLTENMVKSHEEHIGHLSRVLFNMYCYNTYHIWNQLVQIKSDISIETEEKLLGMLTDENQATIDPDNCTLSITPAGKFLAYILPDFEYFAIRYIHPQKNEKSGKAGAFPLFLYDTIKEEKLIKDTIQEVVKKAMDCILKAIDFDTDVYNGKYSNDGGLHKPENNYLWKHQRNDIGVPHPRRIIDNFVTYLDTYRRFVIFNNKEDKEICLRYSIFIVEKIKELIDQMKAIASMEKDGVYYITGTRKPRDSDFDYLYKNYEDKVKVIEGLVKKLKNSPANYVNIIKEIGTTKIEYNK